MADPAAPVGVSPDGSLLAAAQPLDNAFRHARARLDREVHQVLERPAERAEYPPALRAHPDVFVETVALGAREVIFEVVGEVRVGPVVLAHEAAALEESADHFSLSR